MNEVNHRAANGKQLPVPTWSWIQDDLAVGGRIDSDVAECLATHFGIRRVVDLRSEDCDDLEMLYRSKVVHLHLPTPDCRPIPQDMLWGGVRWILKGLKRQEKVLIHCEHGIGRSVLLACCVLVAQGHTPAEALLRVKKARAIASPSPDQLHRLLHWSADWYCKNPPACASVTWDELARIAYQSLSEDSPS